jgi:hypothetical protein
MTDTTDCISAPSSALDRTIRGWNDVLALWRLCRNGKCARSCACRGADARRCFHAHFALAPDSLIAWFQALAVAQQEGLSYDEAIERMRDTPAENALEDWLEAIAWSDRVLRASKLSWPTEGAAQ